MLEVPLTHTRRNQAQPVMLSAGTAPAGLDVFPIPGLFQEFPEIQEETINSFPDTFRLSPANGLVIILVWTGWYAVNSGDLCAEHGVLQIAFRWSSLRTRLIHQDLNHNAGRTTFSILDTGGHFPDWNHARTRTKSNKNAPDRQPSWLILPDIPHGHHDKVSYTDHQPDD